MSLANISLLLSFLAEGISAVKKFIANEEIRTAFAGLQNSQSDDEKEVCAKKIASLIYGS